MSDNFILLPAPRQMELSGSTFSPRLPSRILLEGGTSKALWFAAERLQTAVHQRLGWRWEISPAPVNGGTPAAVVLRLLPGPEVQPERYELAIGPEGAQISAQTERGLFYGVCTLVQLLEQTGESWPCLQISDWPDFPARGVMLDVSRDRVPTMETLFGLIDLLAGWKINQFQLYFEHTFAYRNHQAVWEKASPLTAGEILALDAYCRQRHIELVPNQNSFGHLQRWLAHPQYAPLAEIAGQWVTPWGETAGPFSLCPVDPRSLELIGGLYTELLPLFSSRKFNVGCDETFDLGKGRSQEACASLGTGRVYLDYLRRVYERVKSAGRTMQFWGDIVLKYPELIPELPQDVIALDWGYEDQHRFDEECARFDASGIPFYVCPGTSSWNSLGGRTANALANLKNAAENGLRYGACGYLITDWGDNGHWQPLPVSYLGYAAGAAYAWCFSQNQDLEIPRAVGIHAFKDPTAQMGYLAAALGDVYRASGVIFENSTMLFLIMKYSIEKVRVLRGVSRETIAFQEQALAAALVGLDSAPMACLDADLIRRELSWTGSLMRHACLRGRLAVETDEACAARLRQELDLDLQRLVAEFEPIWLARSRPGGMFDSRARLQKLHLDYVPDLISHSAVPS